MGIALKGDFIGFWIDDIHSSELGIIRTSDGSRFNENLLPTIQDKTVQVPGGDGFYYFGSYYTQRPFNIPIAFDNMEESQFRRLKQILGSKKMVKLVFDEAPYKYYSVKSTGTPTLKYICFDEEGVRVYKGEGTLSFIAYDPFGYARATGLDSLALPDGGEITNQSEWLFEMKDLTGDYQYPLPNINQTGAWTNKDGYGELSGFYNSGDLPADYQIFCVLNTPAEAITIMNSQLVGDIANSDASLVLQLKVSVNEPQTNFCFDSKTNCVYGWELEDGKIIIDYDTIYNKYLITARFDKIPVGAQTLWIQGVKEAPTINIKFKYF